MKPWQDICEGQAPASRLPGAELERFPYISGFGLLVRISRLTALDPCDYFPVLGIRNARNVDLMATCHRPGASHFRFTSAIGLAESEVTSYWDEQMWSPMQLGRLYKRQIFPVRNCPICSRFGYHCTLFQLPSVLRCPWHGKLLTDACKRCGKATLASLDGDGILGRCRCGFDPMDMYAASVRMWSFPTEAADEWLRRYLSWTQDERKTRFLVAPDSTCAWLPGYAALARLPAHLCTSDSVESLVHLQAVTQQDRHDPEQGKFWGWCLLGSDRPLTYVPLRGQLQDALTSATQSVAAALPSELATLFELVTTRGLKQKESFRENLGRKPNIFIAPHTQTAAGKTWLNVSAVDPVTLQMCGRLIEEIVGTLAVGSDLTLDRSPQVAQSELVDGLDGRWRLLRSLELMLCRGYAQGLASLLRSYFAPANRAEKAQWRQPVIEFRGEPGKLTGIRIAWVPTKPTVRRVVNMALPNVSKPKSTAKGMGRRKGPKKAAALRRRVPK